ncbi:DUF6444 domain-containing protein [Streptomyces sp. NPDC003832]
MSGSRPGSWRQEATIAKQAVEIAELKRRLAADSHNSSKPPSSDGLAKKPAPKSLRRRTGRGPGRAKGDLGGRSEQVADPDAIVDHRPDACDGCGNALSDTRSSGYGPVRSSTFPRSPRRSPSIGCTGWSAAAGTSPRPPRPRR